MLEIAAERAGIVSRARGGKLQLADLEGGKFTISNLGMYGIEQFVAVLNPPQVSILAVGSIEDRPTAMDGDLVIVPTMTMTLPCDHRAIEARREPNSFATSRRSSRRPRWHCSLLTWSSGGRAARGSFLRDMLDHAYYWRERNPGDGPGPSARYVKGWGDSATVLIAVDDVPGGRRRTRLFRRGPAPGYGFDDEETPELAIAVVPAGAGAGSARRSSRRSASAHGGRYRALSLSVERENPALCSIYEGHGLGRVEGGDDHSVTMRRPLSIRR